MTALAYSKWVPNSTLDDPAGTTLAASMSIAGALPERTLLRVVNTDGTTAVTFTIKAGDAPPALAAGQGDRAYTVAVSSTVWIGPFDSSRLMQSDGTLSITSSATTGTVTAFLMPRSF